jgi:hypothetical protein
MNVDTGELRTLTEQVEALGRKVTAQTGRISRLDRHMDRLASDRDSISALILVCADLLHRVPADRLPDLDAPRQPRPRGHLRLVDGGKR